MWRIKIIPLLVNADFYVSIYYPKNLKDRNNVFHVLVFPTVFAHNRYIIADRFIAFYIWIELTDHPNYMLNKYMNE